MKKYVCMNAGDLDFPKDTLVIRWKPTHNGIVLTLDYNSTEDEYAAYTDFVKACNQAATDNVIPAVLGETYWYDWEEIAEDYSVPYLEEELPKQYSVIWSPNDEEIVCNIHWESTYEDRFFAG